MQTSVALLAVSLLCFSVAEIPQKEQKCQNDNTQVFVIQWQLEAKLRDTERQLKDLRTDLKTDLRRDLWTDLKTELRRDLWTEIKKEMKDNRVAFGASIGNVGNVGVFSHEITLIYRKVFSNTGAFNPATGIFTAPVRGFYYFSFSGHNHSSRPMGLRLMKNGEQMVTVYNHPAGSRYETATNGMTLQLEVGDKVYMRLRAHTWVLGNVNSHSTFIGHLLFPH